jgi:hypothetical protein
MTTNLNLGRARVRVPHAFGVFRANRRTLDGELLIDGASASSTIFDRERDTRHKLTCETADNAAALAHAEHEKPYSLAVEIARWTYKKVESGARVAWWLTVAASGVGLGVMAAIEANKPDAVLLMQSAGRIHPASPPTAADLRGTAFGMIAVGVGLLILALHGLWNWRRDVPAK